MARQSWSHRLVPKGGQRESVSAASWVARGRRVAFGAGTRSDGRLEAQDPPAFLATVATAHSRGAEVPALLGSCVSQARGT